MTASDIPRATSLLVIEVRNSNPNGDPDRESDPRTRAHDGRGVISDVSFKRKVRELVLEKQGPVWTALQKSMNLKEEEFGIHVDQAARQSDRATRQGAKKSLSDRFWDVRLFGSTSLEEGDNFIRTGVAQFSLGVSIARVRIQRDTNTVKANVDVSKEADRGMAPLGFRIVEHGVYAMPFLINPTAAIKSGCTRRDVELLCRLIPYAYSHNPSRIRPLVEVRNAWFFAHTDQLGSASDFAILDTLTPKKANPDEPSRSWDEYTNVGDAAAKAVRERFSNRFQHFGDLCDPEFLNKVFPPRHG